MPKKLATGQIEQARDKVRTGINDSAIARDLHMDRSTVARIRKRMREPVSSSAMDSAIRDALREHWAQLSSVARAIEQMATLPTVEALLELPAQVDQGWNPVLARGERADVLVHGLRSHLTDDPKGRAFGAWEQAAKELQTAIDDAIGWVRQEESELTRAGQVWLMYWCATQEADADRWLTSDDRALMAAQYTLATDPGLEARFRSLLRQLPETATGTRLVAAWQTAAKRREEIQTTLWEIGYMTGFPGQCRLCPTGLPNADR